MSLGDSVWEREGGYDEISKRMFIFAVSFFTVIGLLMCSFTAYSTLNWEPSIWMLLLVGLGIPILGIFIALGSDYPPVSFVGYSMVAIGIGAILGPTVNMLETGVLVTAIFATTGVTLAMSVVGIIYPKSLESWGGYLLGGLFALIFVRLAQIMLMTLGIFESLWYIAIIEYAAAALFSLYIIYDWNRALRLAHTLDNAIDAALAIFLDVANLFIIMIRIFSNSK